MSLFIEIFANALMTTITFSVPLADKLKFRYKLLMFIAGLVITYTFYYSPLLTPLCIAFNLCIILLFTENKTINVISALFCYVATITANNLLLVFFDKVFGIDIETMFSSMKLLIIFYITFLIVLYLIAILIKQIILKIITKTNFTKAPGTLALIFMELLLCTAIMIFNITYAGVIGYPQETILYNTILFVVYFLLSVLLLLNIVKTTKKNIHMEEELKHAKALEEYTATIEYQSNQLREFKHDYLNTLLTLDELIQDSKHPQLIEYFNEKIKPTSAQVKNIGTELLALNHIKDTAVKSILFTKLSYAKIKGIKLHLMLASDIHSFPMESLELSNVLGIYLDNAIEAAITASEPTISVVFSVADGLTLEISNNFDGDAPDLFLIEKKGYSSKGENRGLGLYHAQQILVKYPDIVHTVNISDNVFIHSLSF